MVSHLRLPFRLAKISLGLLAVLLLTVLFPARAAGPIISEFMASNRASLLDEDGEASDWIELHNPTSTRLDLAGWFLTDEEAKTLILKKLHDVASSELDRYLNAANRHLIQSVENLWEKYAVSSRALESERTETLKTLNGFLTGLGYLK